VPLDACGNPLPVATPAATPAAVSRPTAPAPAAAAPVTTFSDKPADAAPAAAEGWAASTLDHVDPSKGSTESVRVEKPAIEEPLKKIEQIPAPEAKAEPPATAEPKPAATGPDVYPPPPAGAARDVPAAETSGRRRLPADGDDHTT